ncbi:MAG: hypothetical protein JSV16_00040, partial [Candidatus Hydrogenedentota bacterium]
EMTAEDVCASFDRYMVVGIRAGQFNIVESCEAEDEYTVVFQLSERSGSFLKNLATLYGELPIQPKSVILGPDGEPRPRDSFQVPEEIIGTGPYRLVEYEPDTSVVLRRFEGYQPLPGKRDGTGGGKIPYFYEIRMHVVPEPGAQSAGLETGVYDVIYQVSPQDYRRWRDDPVPGVHVKAYYPQSTAVLIFNHAAAFSSDVNFRRAIAVALDLEEIGNYWSGGDPSMFRLDPYLWPKEGAMYLPDEPACEEIYNQKDMERAKQLLEESGYNGEEIVYVATTSYDYLYVQAQAIVDLLRKMGLNVKFETYEWAALVSKWEEEPSWQLSNTSYSSYIVVPEALSFWYSTSESVARNHYVNPEMDAA